MSVTYDDVGRTVQCDQGLGTLQRVSNTPRGRLAIIRLNTGGTVAKPAKYVEVRDDQSN